MTLLTGLIEIFKILTAAWVMFYIPYTIYTYATGKE